ncbi:MAG: adenylosuccinate synthase, partial [Verrucomicrobia bacterium]
MSLLPFTSRLIADVGISLGDEGKGRLIPEVVHELAGSAHPVTVVLKVNGGANSGHTAAGVKLNLLPSGVVEKDIPILAIGAGVVADPRKAWWEALPLERKGYQVLSRLVLDERTLVSDLTHRLLDLAWEDYRVNVLAEEPRGSTGRGITPAYQDEVSQWQITYADFLGGPNFFARKMAQRVDRALRTIRHVCQVSPEAFAGFFDRLTQAEQRANAEAIALGVFTPEEFDFAGFRGTEPFTLNVAKLTETYWQAGQRLLKNIGEVREIILRELHAGHTILGEFGQAYWLDKRHGYSPNVTASHTFTPEFFESAGIPVQAIHTFGVAKAYDTKVGTHVFLTEMDEAHPLSVILKKLEFGTSTGRQRMVGWYDAVEKGDALRYGGFQDVMINKLDALTHQGDWKGDLLLAVAYEDATGKRYPHVPRNDALRKTLRPVYEAYAGWSEDVSHVRHFADLPKNAQKYVGGMMRSMLAVAYHGDRWPHES